MSQEYRRAFYYALGLHFLLMLFLILEPKSNSLATLSMNNIKTHEAPSVVENEPIVKAVSVNSEEVSAELERLKASRDMKLKAEQMRQQRLNQEAQQARLARIHEQQRLSKLKEDAQRIAIARKKQMEDEKNRLKQLALQKAQELKQLEELKASQAQLQAKQQEEVVKLKQLQQKQAEALAKAEQDRIRKQNEEAEKARQEAAQLKAAQAVKEAHLAAEVNKYKAMIVNAISQQWILPDNVDSRLSSQFRIQLAPDGQVLEVTLTRTSGDSVLDHSAQTAIYKASPLPVPKDPETFNLFRDIHLTVRPENVRG